MLGRILQQSFRRQRRRKTLAVLAVIAGMAVASAMLTLRVNLGDDLNTELRTIGANLVVRPASDSLPVTLNGVDLRPAGSGALLPESDLPKIKTIFWTNNIVAFAPELDVPVAVNGQRATLEGAYLEHPVTIPGSGRVMHTGLKMLDKSWTIEGAWPDDASQGVLVGRDLAARWHLAAGASLPLAANRNRIAATVTGIVTTGGGEDNEIIGPLALAQTLAGQPDKYRRVLVSAITKPEDAFARQNPDTMTAAAMERWMCSPYASSIARQLQQALPDSSAAIIRPVANSEGAILSQLQLLIWMLTLLALAASALAIGGAMSAAVLERRGEIALMKAVGAQNAAVGWLFFSEAALLGVGGGALGYLTGEFLAQAIAWHIVGHGLAWKPALAPLILLLGIAVALAGSWQPLRRALRIEPATALRGEA